MQDHDLALAGKAQEAFEMIQQCIDAMEKTKSDEKRMKLLVYSMHLVANVRHIISEALTDNEIEAIKSEIGNEWDMWKKANTAEGAIELLKHYADGEERD
jgi:hypothetical protein